MQIKNAARQTCKTWILHGFKCLRILSFPIPNEENFFRKISKAPARICGRALYMLSQSKNSS